MRSEDVEDRNRSVPTIQLWINFTNHTREHLAPAMSFLALLSIAPDNAFDLVDDKTENVITSLRSVDPANHNKAFLWFRDES